MRSTPEIRFIHDDSIQRGEEVHFLSGKSAFITACVGKAPLSLCCSADCPGSKPCLRCRTVSSLNLTSVKLTLAMQVMAILDRIKRQDAGEIEPPAIALTGNVGANPASEDFLEQSARASRQNAASTADAAAEDDEGGADLGDVEEVRCLLLDVMPLPCPL